MSSETRVEKVTEQFRFEKVTQSNLPDFIEIFNDVFGLNRSLDYFMKRCYRPSMENRFYGCVVYHEKKPVACAGAIPNWMRFGNERQRVVQMVDTAIRVAYRGKGLFRPMYGVVYEGLKADKITCVFGMWHDTLKRGLPLAMKWKIIHTIQRYHIKVQSRKLAKFRYLLIKKIQRQQRSFFKPYLTSQMPVSSLDSPEFIMMERDEDFYQYRKQFGSSFFVKIEEKVLWLKIAGTILHIGDMETPDDDLHLKRILKQLKRVATKAGVHDIIFQSSPGTALERMFSDQYESHPSWTLGFDNFSSNWDMKKLRCTYGDYETF